MNTSLIQFECPCPTEFCSYSQTENENGWGFVEPLPSNVLSPGTRIYSPGKTFVYEICSYPFSRTYIDFKGKTRGLRGTTAIDSPAREFYKWCFLALIDLIIQKYQIPLFVIFWLTCKVSPHLDNNPYLYGNAPAEKPVRMSGQFLSYEVLVLSLGQAKPMTDFPWFVPGEPLASANESFSKCESTTRRTITVRWNPVIVA